MADLLHTDVYDSGLSVLTNATNTVIHLCSSQPAVFADVATYTVGYKNSPTIGSPGARSPSGRKVTVSAVSAGTVTTNAASGAYWAIVDSSRLLATKAVSSPQTVYTANPWSLASFDIGIPGPA